jgi:hypothetical protein
VDYVAVGEILAADSGATAVTLLSVKFWPRRQPRQAAGLAEPGPPRRLATNHHVGTVVQLGTFPAGVELIFGIKVLDTGDTFKMGPGRAGDSDPGGHN